MMRRAVFSAVFLLGCAKTNTLPEPFTTQWLSDAGTSIAAIEAEVRQSPKPPSSNVVVGVGEAAVVGLPLAGGQRWSYSAVPDTQPSIAGELVIFSSRGKLIALNATSGAPLWSVDSDGMWLKGAADDGSTSVATLGRTDGRKSVLLVVSRTGSVVTRISTEIALGRPAARGGIAFVPWAGQYVSAIRMSNGEEDGRLLTRELTSHALNSAGELFFGEKGMLHFDEHVRYANTNQGQRAMLPSRILPGQPRWLGPGATPPVIDPGAPARIRIYAEPVWDGKTTSFSSNEFVATYFRTVLGFDAKTAELRFTHALDTAAIGGGAASNGFVLCTESGKIATFDARGAVSAQLDLATPLRGCSVSAATFKVAAGRDPKGLAEQIDQALGELDPEMAAAQAFLISELGRLEDPIVTKTLIQLATTSRVGPDLRTRARELLAQRRSGAEYMLQALERRYDFLSGDLLPPPVGPLADALAAMKESRAAPLLAKHLNDPSTSAADVRRAAQALTVLASPAELPSLRTFFALYRATADEPDLIASVIAIARALVRIGGDEGKTIVERAARDPLTQPEIARELGTLTAAVAPNATASRPVSANPK